MSDSFVVDGSLIVLPSRGRLFSGEMLDAYNRPSAVIADFAPDRSFNWLDYPKAAVGSEVLIFSPERQF
jgi:hypothetical protein